MPTKLVMSKYLQRKIQKNNIIYNKLNKNIICKFRAVNINFVLASLNNIIYLGQKFIENTKYIKSLNTNHLIRNKLKLKCNTLLCLINT